MAVGQAAVGRRMVLQGRQASLWRDAWRRLLRNKAAVAGGVEDVDFCGGVVGGEVLADAVDCWGGDAEHGDAEFGFGFLGVVDGGVFGLMWRWDLALLVCARHADDASCGVVEHTV